MAEPSIKLFGFEIKRTKAAEQEEKKKVSIVPKNDEDGAGYVTASVSGHYGQYVDINGDQAKDNHQLIMKYRGISMHPEVDMAIEDIVNESIVTAATTTSSPEELPPLNSIKCSIGISPSSINHCLPILAAIFQFT